MMTPGLGIYEHHARLLAGPSGAQSARVLLVLASCGAVAAVAGWLVTRARPTPPTPQRPISRIGEHPDVDLPDAA